MSIEIIIAIVGAGSTLGATIAAWVQVKKLRSPLDQINNAVNHRESGQKRLVEMVESIETELVDLKDHHKKTIKKIDLIGEDLRNHQAYHQKEKELQ